MAENQTEGDKLLVLPEELERATVEWLEKNLKTPAVAYRTEVAKDDEWPWWRTLWDGDHYSGSKLTAPDDFEPFQVNIVRPTIDTVKGIALQSPSVVEFVPMSADDEQFAADLTSIISDYLWGANKARFKLGVAFVEGAIIGTAWAHTFWNENRADGQGDPDFDILPAEEVWVDPGSSGPDNAGYLIHAPRRPVLEVKYDDGKYNDRRTLVESDQAVTEGHKENTPEEQIPTVTVYHYWVRGLHLKALLAEVPGLEAHVDDDGIKYGVLIVVANTYVLKFVSHPWKSERFPYQRFVYYAPDGNQRIYGTGETKMLEDTQLGIDARTTQLMNQAALLSNEQWVVSSLLMVDENELTNKPGQIIHVDGPPDLLKRIAPGGISGALFSTVDLMLRYSEIISGMYQVNRGDTPGSLRAGVAIQALQRGGEGRTRQKMDNFDDFVADIGIGLADIMAVMYDDERVFRITGSTANPDQTAALSPSDPAYAGSEAAVTDPAAAASAGAVPGEVPMTRSVAISSKSFERDGKRVILDARALVGMQLRSTQEQLQADMELLNGGVVDAQYVIENNQLRGKQRLLARLFQIAQSQNAQQPGGQGQEAMMAEGGGEQIPMEEGLSPEEQDQIEQSIEMLLSKMRQLEDDGALPEGMTAKAAQMVQQELANGGTGEEAMAIILQQVQSYTQGGQAGPEYGIAPNMGGL
jgi:hypothetical protein